MLEPASTGDSLWLEASRHIEDEIGLHFPPGQRREMVRGLGAAAARLGLADAAACARGLVTHALSDQQRAVVAECLAIGETYFFRDPELYETLAREVLPPLIETRRRSGRHLRLWSAGCSTGEEAWSLAMLLASLLPEWREWNIEILATDLNEAALAKARAAVYGRWSLRGTVPAGVRHYLAAAPGGRHAVDRSLRPLVRFARHNLVTDPHPSPGNGTANVDVVLCRNVLIYFHGPRACDVLQRLGRCLAPEGWLFTGSAEAPMAPVPGLHRWQVGRLAALRRVAPAHAPRAPAVHAPVVAAPAPVAVRFRAAAPAAPTTPQLPPLPQDARALADAGDLGQAERLCREAIQRDKLDPQWPWLLASILLERGALDEAQRSLQRTLYLDPAHLLARFTLGSLALRRGDAALAARHLVLVHERLAALPPADVVPGSGGVTVRELLATVDRMVATP